MGNIELDPSGIGLVRFLPPPLPCHGPRRGVVLVVSVLGRTPELHIAVLYKVLIPFLTAEPFGLHMVPLQRLFIGVQLAVLYILVMDGLEVYGPLDLFLPVPELIWYGLYALCLCLLLDYLGEPRVYLPVCPPVKHGLYRLSEEGEERVGGRLPAVPSLIVCCRRQDIVSRLGRARHPDLCSDEKLHMLQVVLPPRLLADLVPIVVAGVPDGYPRPLLHYKIRQILLLDGILEICLHIVHIKAYLVLKGGVSEIFLAQLQAPAPVNLVIYPPCGYRRLAALYGFINAEFRFCGLVREVESPLRPSPFKLHAFVGLMISARSSDLSGEGQDEELKPL